ncbi:hypothetical protein TSUD_101020 [Trifolium subterraneum]|uniref:B-like cyclin n=1 Tax=Trifolium subterraneum TaxID=3900 RepID=A0A2Z6NZW8_TRISU|nr:hypothetical protein TSUD_101020 [Trifolium subterraneum]
MASNPNCGQCLRINQYTIPSDNLPTRRMFEDDNRKILIRQHAVSVIAKVAKMYNPPDAYVPYIAMNYFDRLLSLYDLMPALGLTATEKVCLIAVSCYELSANRSANSILFRDLLTDLHKRDMDLTWITPYMVSVMQCSIKEKINKKMYPVTAFWFLDHYYDHFKPLGLQRRSINEIVVQAQGEHTFVDFMPADIAFSACVAAATIALNELPEDINNMITNEVKELVKKMIQLCHRMIILIDKIEVAADEIEAEEQSLAKDKGKGMAVIKKPPPQPQMEGAISATQPTEHMNFKLKWATDVPPLEEEIKHELPADFTIGFLPIIEHAQPAAISLRIPGTGKNINVGFCTCNIS